MQRLVGDESYNAWRQFLTKAVRAYMHSLLASTHTPLEEGETTNFAVPWRMMSATKRMDH